MMPHFSPETLQNRALCSQALAFNPQLPIGGGAGTRLGGEGPDIPPAVELLPDGAAAVCFHAPAAHSVSLRFFDRTVPLRRDGDGFWRGQVPYTTPGFQAFLFLVDGTEVLSPLAPIGFGCSQPMNYIEFPEEDCGFYHLRDVPHGTVAQEVYFSRVTGRYESCVLYLPPDYMGVSGGSYPVLYLQHGHGENEKCWIYQGKVNFIMDNLLAAGEAVPCVIVMNNGMVHAAAPDGSPRMDAGLLERLLVEDCIPFIEGKYRVKTGRENRAMAGLSMGSMQTSVVTLNHPELFAYAGIFSGFLHSFVEEHPENAHLRALDCPETVKSSCRVFFRAMGTDDGFRDIFEEDSALLAARGLSPEDWPAHRIRWYPGGHEWQVWRKCIRDFLPLLFH